MNLTTICLSKQFSEPSQLCLWQSSSADQAVSSNRETIVFQTQQKSLAYVVGERVLKPLINRVSIWGSGVMGLAQKGISAAHFVFNKLTPSLPGVSAAHVYLPTENPLVNTIQDHLEQGKDINEEVNEAGTLLQRAASEGDSEAIQFLIDHEADVNKRSQIIGTTVAKNDRTPLMLAAANGHSLAVYTLLKANPNLELQDDEGQTAFTLAVRSEDTECINLIIERTLEINPQHKFQWPIKLSTHTIDKPDEKFKKAFLSEVKKRIKNSIDLDQPISLSNTGSNPLQVASRLGYLKAMELLIEHHANINVQTHPIFDIFGLIGQITETPLMLASQSGYTAAVQLLLNAKADLNRKNLKGYTALMFSIKNGHIKVTKLLLKAGADLDIKNEFYITAVTMASEGFSAKIYNLVHKELVIRSNRQSINKPIANFEKLVETKVNKRIQDSIYLGQSVHVDQPIFLSKSKFKILSSKFGHSNALDIKKSSPLQLSSKFCYLKAMEILIEHDANINGPKNYDPGFWDYVKWVFFPKDLSIQTPLMEASESGCTAGVRILLKAGVDLNLQGKYGYTALMFASWKGHKEVVDLLIKAGANPDLKSDWGNTALNIAIDRYDAEIVELLIKGGANPNLDCWMCKSPLSYASEHSEKKMVELLIRAGAYLDPSDQLLRDTDLPSLVDLLVERGEEQLIHDLHSTDFDSLPHFES